MRRENFQAGQKSSVKKQRLIVRKVEKDPNTTSERIRVRVFMKNGSNSSGYLEILKQYDRHLNLPDLVFKEDNVPVQKSKIVRHFLAQKQWEVLEWPAYSPDPNPFRKIWAIFKSLRCRIVTWENLQE